VKGPRDTALLILVQASAVIWGCPSGNFYILVSVSKPVSSGLKSDSIVEYYLKKARHFVKLCKLELGMLLVKFGSYDRNQNCKTVKRGPINGGIERPEYVVQASSPCPVIVELSATTIR